MTARDVRGTVFIDSGGNTEVLVEGAELTGYEAARYGESVGDDYDTLYPGEEDQNEAAVSRLAALAGCGPEYSLLEFGIGTGRLSLPLSRLGIAVGGIDGSQRMIDILRRKPGGHRIELAMGDYRSTVLGTRKFGVVVLAFNGIFDPRGIAAQLDIFRNAARHLAAGGFFVIETWVMSDLQRNGSWSVMPRYVGQEHAELQLARFDIERNSIERTLVHIRPSGMQFIRVTDTYASPGQLDVMAEATGFHRIDRFATWSGGPFTVASTNCISVYERGPD